MPSCIQPSSLIEEASRGSSCSSHRPFVKSRRETEGVGVGGGRVVGALVGVRVGIGGPVAGVLVRVRVAIAGRGVGVLVGVGVGVDAKASGTASVVDVGRRASTVAAIAASVVARTSGMGLGAVRAVATAACTRTSISRGVSVAVAADGPGLPMNSSTRERTFWSLP